MSANDEQIPKEMSDAELVGAAKAGQLQAFGELVERTEGLARAVAFNASSDVANVEDLVQEALVTAWTRLPDLSDPAAFRPWLAGIVRNTVRYWRRHQRRHAPRAQAGMETLSQLASSAPSPLDEAEWQQDWQHTKRALQSLPEKYREPLVLYYSLGESHAQVAQALGLTEASARQRVHRARKKLSTEVGLVASGGRRLASRASAAAGVLMAIRGREAWASAPATPGLTSAAGPKFFLGLGALGGAAVVGCIVAFVMLLSPENESLGSSNAQHTPPLRAADVVSTDVVSTDALSTDVLASEGAPATAPEMDSSASDVAGLVSIGRGNVGDKALTNTTRLHEPASAFTRKDSKTFSEDTDIDSDSDIDTDTDSEQRDVRRSNGRIKKHGPAVLEPKEQKPLMTPDIDMRAVQRELWQ